MPATVERTVPGSRVAAVHAFAADLGVPAKSVYLAAHLTVLGRLTERNQVVSGLVTSGRPELEGGTDLVGLFLNTLPVPFRLQRGTWQSRVERVFAVEQRSVPYRRFPLADIIKLTGGRPLFDTIFNYTDFHVYADASGAASARAACGSLGRGTSSRPTSTLWCICTTTPSATTSASS